MFGKAFVIRLFEMREKDFMPDEPKKRKKKKRLKKKKKKKQQLVSSELVNNNKKHRFFMNTGRKELWVTNSKSKTLLL